MTPTVSADIYRDTGCREAGGGSVGQTGRFTFSSSADVASYKWGFTDPPSDVLVPATLGGSVSVDWTPTSGGIKNLHVIAVDRSGNEARTLYQFFVAPGSPAVARWKLNEPAGSTELVDDTGNGLTATVYGGATLDVPGRIAPGPDEVSRSAMGLDGIDDYAARPAVLDTSRSFSVSPWVKLGAKGTTNQNVLNELGSLRSSFYLEYDSSDRWLLRVPSNDVSTPAPTWWSALSTTVPRIGVWTHLAGVPDSAGHTMKLYVNGRLEATVSGVTAWSRTGLFRIGRGRNTYLTGSVAEVQAWNRVISAGDVFGLVDPERVGLVGQYGAAPRRDLSAPEKSLRPPSDRTNQRDQPKEDSMIANVRRAAAALALLTTLSACGGNGAETGDGGGSGMSVSVTKPTADATVAVPFEVAVTASVPLGPTESGKHHVHVWFDDNEDDYQVVETPTVRITELAPGPHVMHVSLANANHSPAGAEAEVPITVGGAGAPAPASGPASEPAPDDPYGY